MLIVMIIKQMTGTFFIGTQPLVGANCFMHSNMLSCPMFAFAREEPWLNKLHIGHAIILHIFLL